MKWRSTCVGLLFLFFSTIRTHAQAPARTWQDVGADTTELGFVFTDGDEIADDGYVLLEVSPTGQPYYVYMSFRSREGTPSTIYAQTFVGGHWVHIDPGVQNGYSFQTAMDKAGNLYMGLVAGDTTTVIYKYNGTSWSVFGTGPGGNQSLLTMAVSSSGAPSYALFNGGNEPSIYKWNGTGFTSVDTTGLGYVYAGPGTIGGVNYQLHFDRQDSLYVTFDQQTVSGQYAQLYVHKYNGTTWRLIGNGLVSAFATNPLAFDSHNTPFVVGAAGSAATGFNLQVEKLTSGNWSAVGPVVPGAAAVYYAAGGEALNENVSLRIGVADTPNIIFTQPSNTDTSYSAVAYKLAGASWQQMGVHLLNPGENPVYLEMKTDSTGNPYVKYIVKDNSGAGNDVPRVKNLSPGLVKPTAFITFPSTLIGGYYGQDFAPGATSTNTDSADPITYTIADTTIATIVNGMVHPLKVGRTTITANQAADDSFQAALPVTVGLYVDPGYQQLAFPGIPEKKVGDSDFHAVAYSSGGPLVFSGSDSTIAKVYPDGLIHILGFGQIIVTVYAANDSLYQATGTLSQILTIQPADSTGGGSGTDSTVAKGMTAFVSGGMMIVNVSVPAAQQARLQLFNSVGRLVYNQEIGLTAGVNQFQFPIENDRHGIYYLRCAGNGLQLIQSMWIP